VNEALVAGLQQVADGILDLRGLNADAGTARHRLGFTVTRDHIAQAESGRRVVRAEGLFAAPATCPFKSKWVYVVLLADEGVVQRHLIDGATLVTLQQTAASCIEAAFREAWMHALAEPNPMRCFSYLAQQGGLHVDERVVTTQAAIDVPALDATMLVFWFVPSLNPEEPAFIVRSA
jgi:hypothetical protein